jgi:hypothetical protein
MATGSVPPNKFVPQNIFRSSADKGSLLNNYQNKRQQRCKALGIVATVPLTPGILVERMKTYWQREVLLVDSRDGQSHPFAALPSFTKVRPPVQSPQPFTRLCPIYDLYLKHEWEKGVRQRVGVFYPPPVLPLPPTRAISLSEYLQLTGLTFSADSPAEKGVGVLLASREEITFFVVRQVGDIRRLLFDPVRFVCDDVVASGGFRTASDREEEAVATNGDVLKALSSCTAFVEASVWWFRVESTQAELFRRAAAAKDAPLLRVSLDDPRWTSLPRERLMRNPKLVLDPEKTAFAMQNGLLEVMEKRF